MSHKSLEFYLTLVLILGIICTCTYLKIKIVKRIKELNRNFIHEKNVRNGTIGLDNGLHHTDKKYQESMSNTKRIIKDLHLLEFVDIILIPSCILCLAILGYLLI